MSRQKWVLQHPWFVHGKEMPASQPVNNWQFYQKFMVLRRQI